MHTRAALEAHPERFLPLSHAGVPRGRVAAGRSVGDGAGRACGAAWYRSALVGSDAGHPYIASDGSRSGFQLAWPRPRLGAVACGGRSRALRPTAIRRTACVRRDRDGDAAEFDTAEVPGRPATSARRSRSSGWLVLPFGARGVRRCDLRCARPALHGAGSASGSLVVAARGAGRPRDGLEPNLPPGALALRRHRGIAARRRSSPHSIRQPRTDEFEKRTSHA